jgi:aspartate beta-hydroxylase
MNAVADSVTQARTLVDAAERAAAAGQNADAARILARAQALSPDDPLVLNAVGAQALRAGDAAGARKFLERAIAGDAKNPGFWVNLASAYRGLNDADAELATLEKALVLAPRHILALLQKGSLFERQGKQKKAAVAYHAALLCMPGVSLPRALKPVIDHAVEAVRANNRALEGFLQERLREARSRVGAERLDRFEDCLDVLLGKKRVYVQQPTFLNFPYLPALQFYPRHEFAWLAALEAATEDIRRELLGVLAEDTGGLEPYIAYPDGVPLDQWAELNRSPRWSAYFLWREGTPVGQHLTRCPRTAAALEQVPRPQIPAHAPGAFFSLLRPKTRIPPHTGVTNTRVTVHLPLVVPPGCHFRVGSETREVRAGEAWVFDDTIEHEAWNDSDETRAILIFDIWNPFLSASERELLRLMIPGLSDYYEGESPFAAAP